MPATRKAVPAPSPLQNRLAKRARHLEAWAARAGTNAYRLFDRDIPSYHFAVDRYGPYLVVAEYPWKEGDPRHLRRREELLEAVEVVCGVERSHVVLKTHLRQRWGESQPGRGGADLRVVVEERPARFEVNLGPYLDVGLFLDHRDTRRLVRERCEGKRVLNLFAYTGSFTVAAALGGAKATVSVDLSQTYLSWARRNLSLNGIAGAAHALVAADAVAFAEAPGELFDLIVCDPPPHSSSKRARGFEVQRDHAALLLALAEHLAPGGEILFSSNLGGFTLAPEVLEAMGGKELTPGSLPEDFRGKTPHRAWLLGGRWRRARV